VGVNEVNGVRTYEEDFDMFIDKPEVQIDRVEPMEPEEIFDGDIGSLINIWG